MGTDPQIKDSKEAIIFFDGVCNLCNGAVQFVIKRDRKKYFRFSSLQSSKASKALPAYGIIPSELESIILLENGRAFQKSSAILKISSRLSAIWPAMQIFWIIPRPVRDWIYDWIARNRYQWFGRQDECMVPTPDLRSRFIESE